MTAGIAAGLRAHGVGPGDRVVAYMPNIPETIAAFLACASIGAVWSSCSPDFGARSVVDRFAQIEPKVLLAVDGYRYNGKDFDRREVVAGIAEEIGGGVEVVDVRLPRRHRLARAASPGGGAAGVRAAALRPPAVGALQLGHHRPAEGDRALAGRHPARAPEEAEPAPRRPARRPRVLVHHHRLDDVELPRGRAAHARRDRALRRQPRPPGPRRAVGPGRADAA